MNKDQEQPLDPEYEDDIEETLNDALKEIALSQAIDELLEKWRIEDE